LLGEARHEQAYLKQAGLEEPFLEEGVLEQPYLDKPARNWLNSSTASSRVWYPL
jgi:hypothetical protein